MDKEINVVCVVTNFRTASTTFTLLKSEEYNLPYKAEMFSHEFPYRLGEAPARWELERQGRLSKFEKTPIDKLFLQELKKPTPCCFKLMPEQISDLQVRNEVVDFADKRYYLYRRNFKAQALSWISARLIGNWRETGFRFTAPEFTIERLKQIHLGTEGKEEKIVRVIDKSVRKRTTLTIEALCEELVGNYIQMSKLYKQFPGELICMEDYFSEERYNPYNKETVWEEMPEIEDFDVESLFK